MAKAYFDRYLRHFDTEQYMVVFVDADGNILASSIMFSGSANEVKVDIQQIVKAALLSNADAVLTAHNHPQGEAYPSVNDLNATAELRDGLAAVGVPLWDHIVVGAEPISLVEDGYL